jgi:hypothetical protein
MTLLLQMELGILGIIGGTIFFLVLAAAAYITFRLMRRTVKMAIRMTIVAVILLVALVGSIAIYWKSGSSAKPVTKPTANRSR